MTNYNKFYNAWQSFTKPKRQLLLEEEPVPVINSHLEVGQDEHSFKVKANSATFVKLTSDEKTRKNIKARADKMGKFDPVKAGQKIFLRLDANGKVLEHEGRARNQLNVNTNGENAELNIEIIIPKDKALSPTDMPRITGQYGMADDVEVSLEQLIPGIVEAPTTGKAEKRFKDSVEEAKKKVGSGFVFVQKYYPSLSGGPPVRNTFTADSQISSILGPVFSAFKDLKVSQNPQSYNTGKADGGASYLPSSQLEQLRNQLAKEMNNHFDVTNDTGQSFVIVNYKSGSGMYFFGLRKPGNETVVKETPQEEAEKDKVIFKAK